MNKDMMTFETEEEYAEYEEAVIMAAEALRDYLKDEAALAEYERTRGAREEELCS